LRSAFEAEYSRQFARSVPGMTIEILNWAVRISTVASAAPRSASGIIARPLQAKRFREIVCDVTGEQVAAGFFQRNELAPGDSVAGPALIVEPQTTTLVSRDFAAEVLADGSLLLTRVTVEEQRP
jgi:N-methylhydantoinase A